MSFCKNCGEKVVGSYCSHCGQKTIEQRISFHYISHEVLHFFTHFEKGFLFTSWNMLAKPGKVVTDFVKGKRKIYQPPVSFFLIWITMYLLLIVYSSKDLWRKCGDRLQRIFWTHHQQQSMQSVI
jgi:hypothetical protein